MFSWFRPKGVVVVKEKAPSMSFFSTDIPAPNNRFRAAQRAEIFEEAMRRTFQVRPQDVVGVQPDGTKFAMDDNNQMIEAKSSFSDFLPDAQVLWYASNGFINYQFCAMFAQHWLVDKACTMPARDAVSVGFATNVVGNEVVVPEALQLLEEIDEEYCLIDNLVEFVRKGRMFGIRIAMFIVESRDPNYYSNPFNPDGVVPGSYKGIKQIDPFWIIPELDNLSMSNPLSPDFYEPTWWRVGNTRIHKSHLIIMRTNEVADTLKPTYLYGGVPVPQRIYERVYAAERTANEGPILSMSKRMSVLFTDMAGAMADQGSFEAKMKFWTENRDNHGVKVLGYEDKYEQYDTSLNDLDMVIMTQFQLVAAASGVPSTKLLGTSPKGFNPTGEYENDSYHEELRSIQRHDLTPLVNRHHLLAIRSRVAPELNIPIFRTKIAWESLDSPTSQELADINLKNAQADAVLMTSGAIDGRDIRQRLIDDPTSGYNNLSMEEVVEEPDEDPINNPLASEPLLPENQNAQASLN